MKNNLAMILLIVLLVSSCDGQSSSGLDELSLKNIEIGDCEILPEMSKVILNKPNYLRGYEVYDNILQLDLAFENTCGSDYEIVSINKNGNIHLSLTDTSSSHQRCICEYNCSLSYEIASISKVELTLDIKFYSQEEYITCLDTTLVLHRNLINE